MPEQNWEVIDEVAGDIQAEMLRGLLEAQGFQVWLSQEGAGRAYGLTLSKLGAVQILVPSDSVEGARHVLNDYYAGFYAEENLQTEEPGAEANQDDSDDQGEDKPESNPSGQG